MAPDVGISVGIVPDTSGERVIVRSLQSVAAANNNTTQSSLRLQAQMKAMQGITAGLSSAFGGLIAAMGLREIARISDQYTLLNARLKNITGSVGEANRAMAELRRISAQTGTSMDASIQIMQRLSFVRQEINASNKDMLDFTATVAKLGVISGASSDALKFGLTQLGQSLSSQIMRAEEFNSIMENIPGVGKAIADQFGVTTGQLRQLVINGKVLSSDVFAAILNQTEKVREEMEKMPRTIAMAGNEAQQSFEQLIAKIMGTTDATQGYVKIIDFGNERLKEMTATVDVIRLSFEFMGDRVKVTFNNIAYEIQQLYNRASQALYDLSGGRVDMGIKSDVFKLGYNQSVDQFNTAKANAVRAAMGEEYGPSSPSQQRKISQDYAKIAAGLSGDAEGAKKAAAAAKKQQQELTAAINGSRTEQERLNDEIVHLEKLKGVAKTKEQVDLLNRGISNTRTELEKLRLQTELDSPMAKAFKGIADEVQDGFKDAFKGAFDGGGSLFKKFADGIKATFKSLLLDLAYQAAVRPIVVSILGAGGQAAGLSGAAVGSILGTSGGTSGGASLLGSAGSLLNIGKALFSGQSITGGLGTLAGKASAFFGGSFGQNVAFQKFFTQAGTLGNLAGGFAGGLGANLLGLGSSNALIDGGLGTVGGLIGSLGGPIGSFAGSFLGTALGGLFGGGKPSDMAQGGGVNLEDLTRWTNGQTGKKFSQQNASFRDGVMNEATTLAQLLQSVGGKSTGTVYVTVGSRDGLRLGYGAGEQNFGNNQTAFIQAVMQQVVNQTTGLSETFQRILDKIGVGDTQKLAGGFAFGQWYEGLGKTVDPLADAMKALNEQFDALRQQATDLGFPLEKINTEYDKQAATLKAQAAGFASLDQMTKAFDDFFNGQALSANSSLSPMGKLQVAQNAFGSLLTKAQGGDLSVTPDLLNSANQLLDVGRNTYASGVDFSNIESFVRSSVQGVAQQTGYTGQNVSYSIISTNTLVANNVEQMSRDIQDLKAEIFRLTNKLAAA